MRSLTTATVAVCFLAMAGCGSDSDGDTSAACDAFVDYSVAFDIEQNVTDGLTHLKGFVEAVPDNDVAQALEPLVAQLEADPEAVYEMEGPIPGDNEADQWTLDHCGDTTIELEAYNFAFPDVPSTIDAGRVVFNLVNRTQTDEFHEAILLRQHEDATEAPHDQLIAALPETISAETTLAAIAQFDFVAVGFVEPDGGDTQDVFAADLEPGQYILTCLLPDESSEHLEAYFSGEEITGEHRHDELGMFVTFTVT